MHAASYVMLDDYHCYNESTQVQTLGAVAITACTDDASIAGLSPLNWPISFVSYLVLHAAESVHIHVCMYYSLVPRLSRLLMDAQSYR